MLKGNDRLQMIKLLSQKQQDMLELLDKGDIDTLLEMYEWNNIYMSIPTYQALGLVDFKQNINYPEQLKKIFK